MMQRPPTKYGVLLFPGFQLLDVCGPLDMLNLLAVTTEWGATLYIIAETMEPVHTRPGQALSQTMLPTHTFDTCPDDMEVLLVPGGFGLRTPSYYEAAIPFIKRVYPKLQYLLTVCTGSALCAQAGVLDGKKATTNKASYQWVSFWLDVGEHCLTPILQAIQFGPKVDWQPAARWVVDGNCWTSSGVSAGMDLMCAFLAEMHTESVADNIAQRSEYTRTKDAEIDPFAEFYGLA